MWNEGNVGQNYILKQFILNFGFHKKKSYRNALQFVKMSTFWEWR